MSETKSYSFIRGPQIIESSYSFRQIDASGWVGKSDTLRFEILIFVILFNLQKNNWCKNKASKNPLNIIKNQKIELFTSCHYKNLISPKPMKQSVESNFFEKIKAIV